VPRSPKKHAPKRPIRISPLGALRVVDPEAWEKAVRKAMKAAKGGLPEAAEALGITSRQLSRWLDDPRLSDVPRAPVGVHRE